MVKKNNNISFSKDQEKAIDELIKFIAEDFDDKSFVRGLCGAGGTGKTFAMKYIINNCKYAFSVIKACAPTHKACRVLENSIGINVDTIQSTFGFRPDMKLEEFDADNPKFAPIGNAKIEAARLLIIDEASMLNKSLMNYIYKNCKNNQIKIILLGDTSQLPPVNESKSIAFEYCKQILYLKEIIRQKSTNPATALLEMLRQDIKNKTFNFIEYVYKHKGLSNFNENNEGFAICSKEQFKLMIANSFSDENFTKDVDLCRIVAYTNNRVSYWNNYIRGEIINNHQNAIILKDDLIMSYDTIVDEFMSPILYNSEEYIIKSIVDYVSPDYNFKGYLIQFQMIHGGFTTKPIFIIDHKDRDTIYKYMNIRNELLSAARNSSAANRVSNWKAYYNFIKTHLLLTNIVERTGKILFPRNLDYGFAITAHRAQGSTYNTVFVDLYDMVYDSKGRIYSDQNELLRRIYVGCSRASDKLIICYEQQ